MRFTFLPQAPKHKDIVLLRLGKHLHDHVILLPGGQKALAVDIDDGTHLTRRKLMLLVRKIIMLARKHHIKRLGLKLDDFDFPKLNIEPADLGELLAVNMELANFEFVHYKSSAPTKGWNFLEEVIVIGLAGPDVKKAMERGHVIGEKINLGRHWINMHSLEMTPSRLAQETVKESKGTKVKVKVLGKKDMQKLGMHSILAVARGSRQEPKFIIAEYFGGGKEKPIALVGKGVMFDSGGMNLKVGRKHLLDMQMDMSGGAAVLQTVFAAAALKMKKNMVAIVPAVENMISNESYRPTDIVKTMSGKTIEVMDTDAEGRMILADALTYSLRYKPRLIVDVASLTGAMWVTLGMRASGIFTKDQKLEDLTRALGEESGDYVWPLPLWDDYEEEIKGTFGDIANVGKEPSFAQSIHGAIFLYQFVKGWPWMHIDMASRMTAMDNEYLAKGATGEPVRLLVKLLEKY